MLLSWTNPDDTDFYGTRITFSASDSSARGVTQSIVVEGEASGTSSVKIQGLTNYTEYMFNLYALDTSQNAAGVVCVSAMPYAAPAAVSAFTASYDYSTTSITLSWTEPSDSNYSYVVITSGGTTVATASAGTTTYTISNVDPDGTERTYTAITCDALGNYDSANVTTASVTPSMAVFVTGITLSRYHIAYDDDDQTLTANASLSNIDLLDSDTVVKLQTKDTDGNVTNTVATVDTTASTATATIAAPATTSCKTGMTYTVLCKIGNEAADTTHTTRFNVSSTASLAGLRQSRNGSTFSRAPRKTPIIFKRIQIC